MGERRTPFERQLEETPDGRLDAPAFHRNFQPILDVLVRHLAGRDGEVLEIGSGTGQHIVGFARALPALTWWPSDPNPAHRASVDAWRRETGAENVRPALALDASEPSLNLGGDGQPPGRALTAIVSMNVIHIAPWSVAEGIIRLAGENLTQAGLLFLYGPFKRDGAHTAPSNAAFDATLRRENEAWGVRDLEMVAELAATRALRLAETVEMPANNLTLVFARDGGGG